MKTALAEKAHYIVDASGQRVGVAPDLSAYEHLSEAAEDNLVVRACQAKTDFCDRV